MKRALLALASLLVFAVAAAPRLSAPDSLRSALLYTPFGIARALAENDEHAFWTYRMQTCARTPPWRSPLLGGLLALHTVVAAFALTRWIRRSDA